MSPWRIVYCRFVPALLVTALVLAPVCPLVSAKEALGAVSLDSVDRGVLAQVSPSRGAMGVRPGTPVVFSLSSLGQSASDLVQRVSQGQFRAYVFESTRQGHCTYSCIQPGQGASFNPETSMLTVSIPFQKPDTQYYVTVSPTPGYRPKLWPHDRTGSKVVAQAEPKSAIFFGSRSPNTINASLRGSLMAGERVTTSGQKLVTVQRRLAPRMLSTVFWTGAAVGNLERLVIESADKGIVGTPAKVAVSAQDRYGNSCPCEIELLPPGSGDITSVVARDVTSSPGHLQFYVVSHLPQETSIRVRAKYGEASLVETKTLQFRAPHSRPE